MKTEQNNTPNPTNSTITNSHYTKSGDHPEDRIFRDKEYTQRLQKHIDEVYESLAQDLRLNESGRDWLFDFFYNEEDNIEFEDYLQKSGILYKDLVKQ